MIAARWERCSGAEGLEKVRAGDLSAGDDSLLGLKMVVPEAPLEVIREELFDPFFGVLQVENPLNFPMVEITLSAFRELGPLRYVASHGLFRVRGQIGQEIGFQGERLDVFRIDDPIEAISRLSAIDSASLSQEPESILSGILHHGRPAADAVSGVEDLDDVLRIVVFSGPVPVDPEVVPLNKTAHNRGQPVMNDDGERRRLRLSLEDLGDDQGHMMFIARSLVGSAGVRNILDRAGLHVPDDNEFRALRELGILEVRARPRVGRGREQAHDEDQGYPHEGNVRVEKSFSCKIHSFINKYIAAAGAVPHRAWRSRRVHCHGRRTCRPDPSGDGRWPAGRIRAGSGFFAGLRSVWVTPA